MTEMRAEGLIKEGEKPAQSLTPRQRQVLRLLPGGLARINLFCGSVRSGKTWGSLLLWALWVALQKRDAPFLMVGKTSETLRRNCLDVLQKLVGEKNFVFNFGKGRGMLFGRVVLFLGAADARAEAKIRGLTLSGAYCDEVSLFPEDFFAMLLSRLSTKGAKLIATTNPENPGHWLKKQYMDRGDELDLRVEEFLLEDNVFLDAAYVKNLKNEYTGAFYDRYILGKWVAAEGAVYPLFADGGAKFLWEKGKKVPFDFIQVGIDFGGNKSAFAFVACGICQKFNGLYALASRRVPAKGVHPEAMYQHIEGFLDFVEQKYGKVKLIYADSAEQTLINGMRKRLCVPVRCSIKNPILQRLRALNLLLSQERFWLTEDCESLKEALQNALFAKGKERDERLDNGSTDIDSLDAFEYSFERYLHSYVKWQKKERREHDF